MGRPVKFGTKQARARAKTSRKKSMKRKRYREKREQAIDKERAPRPDSDNEEIDVQHVTAALQDEGNDDANIDPDHEAMDVDLQDDNNDRQDEWRAPMALPIQHVVHRSPPRRRQHSPEAQEREEQEAPIVEQVPRRRPPQHPQPAPPLPPALQRRSPSSEGGGASDDPDNDNGGMDVENNNFEEEQESTQEVESDSHQGDEDTVSTDSSVRADVAQLARNQEQGQITEAEKVQDLCNAIVSVKTTSRMSDASVEKMIKVFLTRADLLKKLKDEGKNLSYRKFVKKRVMKLLPKIRFAVLISDSNTDPKTYTYHANLKSIPDEFLRLGNDEGRILLRQDAYTTVPEVKEFHKRRMTCRGQAELFLEHCSKLDMSVDGVREAEKGKRTFYLVSIRFGSDIYALAVFNPLKGYQDAKPTPDDLLQPHIEEILKDPELILRFIIADTPERRYLKCMQNHAGKYSCETCAAFAETIPHTHWPLGTFGKRVRQEDDWMFFAEHLDDLDLEQREGVTGMSPLLKLPAPFSILWSVPTESFHLFQEGVTKLIVRRLFELTSTVESRAIMEEWNFLYKNTAVFKESARYTRDINASNFKGSEFAMLMFTGFPPLINLLSNRRADHWEHAQRAIAIFSFLARAYHVSNVQYSKVKEALALRGWDLKKLHRAFYKEFSLGLCNKAKWYPTANIHAFSHIYQMREKTGLPLWETSAEPFESAYSVVRRSYQVGTKNTPRQVMENVYLRQVHNTYTSKKRCLFVGNDTSSSKVRDSIVLVNGEVLETYGEDKQPRSAYLIKTSQFVPDVPMDLPWDLVGVYKFQEYNFREKRLVWDKQVEAKLMRCGDLLLAWELPWLMSKIDD